MTKILMREAEALVPVKRAAMPKRAKSLPVRTCTAYGFLDHSLKEDCATITISLKGVSDGQTKTIYP